MDSFHGSISQLTTNPGYMDLVIQKYLPASVSELRQIIKEKSDGIIDYSDIYTMTECLFILSEYEGFNR